jgi:hypothetical protein
MLAKMISENWENDPEKPIFIDRDGGKFSLVLDYLLYGSIVLPIVTPEAMFLRELDYYGIEVESGSVAEVKKKTLAEITDEINERKMNIEIFDLAVECYNRFGAAVECYTRFKNKSFGIKTVSFMLDDKKDADCVAVLDMMALSLWRIFLIIILD